MNPEEMSTTERQIEVSLADAEAAVSLADELQALILHPAFDKIVTKGYFTDNAVRTVSLLADSAMQEPREQDGLIADLQAISATQRYFRDIIIRGKQMEAKIASHHAALEELEELKSEDAGE